MELHVLEGNMVVEIKNAAVNKGTAASKWLGNGTYDFVMAIGDDRTDEDTFDAMPEGSYTIKVGGSRSSARYSIENPDEVRKLLRNL